MGRSNEIMNIEEISKVYESCKDSYHRHCDNCPVTDDCCHDKMPLFVLKYAIELMEEQQKTIERLGEAFNNVNENDNKSTIPGVDLKRDESMEKYEHNGMTETVSRTIEQDKVFQMFTDMIAWVAKRALSGYEFEQFIQEFFKEKD